MRRALLTLTAALILGGCVPGHELVVKKRARVGIVPKFSLHVMERRYRPLWDYLSERTGLAIEPVSGATYEAFLSSIEGAKADVAFVNGLLYLILAKTRGARVVLVALSPDRSRTSKGLIISRIDKGVGEVPDLKGKVVAVPSRKSLFGYLAQCDLCRQFDLLPDRDFTVVVSRKHDFVVMDVWRGRVDAGFVSEDAYSEMGEVLDLSNVRVVAETAPYPNWCLVSFPESDPVVVRKIRAALFSLSPLIPAHKAILSPAGLGGFAEPQPGEFADVGRAMILLNLPY